MDSGNKKKRFLEREFQEDPHHFVHENKLGCYSCAKKLRQVHPKLVEWVDWVKEKRPYVHVSCGWRNQVDQENLYKEGKTKLHYPFSMHNKVDNNGIPKSHAVDIFQIDEDGNARWSFTFFKTIYEESFKNEWPVTWGGLWKTFPDGPHFQLITKLP